MKIKTYNILRHIPIVNTILEVSGNGAPRICSSLREEIGEDSKYINEYAKNHPDEFISKKKFFKILRENRTNTKD